MQEHVADFGLTINIPRKKSVVTDDPKEYYEESLYISFLDELIESIEQRFTEHQKLLKGFDCLFHNKQKTLNLDQVRGLFATYEGELEAISFDSFIVELELWREKTMDMILTVGEAVDFSERSGAFFNVNKLLKILMVLPITTASAERTFSALRRIKTYLRNTTAEMRLVGLALLNINRDIYVSSEEVLEEFSLSNRRILLEDEED